MIYDFFKVIFSSSMSSGPSAQTLLDYLKEQGGGNMEGSQNPADYMLQVLSKPPMRHQTWSDAWRSSHQFDDCTQLIQSKEYLPNNVQPLSQASRDLPGLWYQVNRR